MHFVDMVTTYGDKSDKSFDPFSTNLDENDAFEVFFLTFKVLY